MVSEGYGKTRLVGMFIGFTATLVVGIFFYVGIFNRIELLSIDFRFKYFNFIKDSHQLAIIGIDDSSLESVGDWPWPRTYIGQILRSVKGLGAKVILVDLIYRKRKDTPVNVGQEKPLTEDEYFAQCIESANPVVLAFFFEQPQLDKDTYKLVDYLTKDFGLSDVELAEKSSLPIGKVKTRSATVRRIVARKIIIDMLRNRPEVEFNDIVEKFNIKDKSRLAELMPIIKNSYLYAKSYLLISRKSGWRVVGDLPSSVRKIGFPIQMTIPVLNLTRATDDFGFVSFKRDIDGKIREVQLLAHYDDKIYRQFALAGFMEAMEVKPEKVKLGEQGVLIESNNSVYVHIPLVDKGKLIVNWYAPTQNWQRSFNAMIPAAVVLDYATKIDRLSKCREIIKDAKEVAIRKYLPAKYERYKKLKQRIPFLIASSDRLLRGKISLALKSGKGKIAFDEKGLLPLERNIVESYRSTISEIREIEEQAKEQVDWLGSQLEEVGESGSSEGDEVRLLWLALNKPDDLKKQIEILETQVRKYREHLEPMIRDRIVLLGYVASTLADFVSTPTFKELPGVIVHANIVNQLIQQNFLVKSEKNTDILIIFLLGVVVSLISSTRSALEAFFWMFLLVIVFGFISGYLLFEKFGVIVPMITPVLSIFLSWSAVGLYREITEGRAKRVFMNRLKQYTNPALVKRIAEDPTKLLLRPEKRLMTCFFSDLAGFTNISERLGPEKVVRLLNVYLEHMSEVLDRYEAFINKFQGDGIFAFFNPPINPQEDHIIRSAMAAIDSQEYLPHIKQHLVGMGLIDEETPFTMRIGISTGEVVVGDCGSTRKFDYTCVGDTVNLAARLESASKFFGTKIIICENTYKGLDDKFLCRLLGKIRVVGRDTPIIIYELIGFRDQRDLKDQEFAMLFSDMVKSFWERNFEQMEKALNQLDGYRPDDVSVRIYWDILNKCRADESCFNEGVIVLESK